jgi:hypothetical protein
MRQITFIWCGKIALALASKTTRLEHGFVFVEAALPVGDQNLADKTKSSSSCQLIISKVAQHLSRRLTDPRKKPGYAFSPSGIPSGPL